MFMSKENNRAKKVVLPIALSLAMVAGILPMNAKANGSGEPNDGGLVGTVATPTDTEGPKLPERIDNITDEEYDRLLVGSVLDAFLEGNEDAQALYDQLSDELKALVDASLEIETNGNNEGNVLPNSVAAVDTLKLTYNVEIKLNNAYQIFSENNPIKEIYINGNQADVTGNSFTYNFIYEWDKIEIVDSFNNRYDVKFNFFRGFPLFGVPAELTITSFKLKSEHSDNMGYFYAYVTGDEPVSVEEALTNDDFKFLGRTGIATPESTENTSDKEVINQALASVNYGDLNLQGKKFEAFRMMYGNAPQGPWDSTPVWHVDGLLVNENTYAVNFHYLDKNGNKKTESVVNVTENSVLNEEFIPNVPQQVLSKKFVGWSLTEDGEKINPADYVVTGNTDFYALYEEVTEKEEAYYYVLKPGMAVPEGTSDSETENWYFFGKGTINKVENYENTADSAIVGYATSDFNPADLEDGYNADRNKERYQLKEDEEFIPIRLMWGNSPDAEDEVKSVWHVDGIVKKVGNYLVNYHYGLDLDKLKSFEFDVNTTSVIGSNVPDESLYNVPGYKFQGWITKKPNGEMDQWVDHEDLANIEVTSDMHFYAYYTDLTPGGGETTEDIRTFNVKHVYGNEVVNDTLTVDVNEYKNADGSYRFDEILGLPDSKPKDTYLEEANGRYWEGSTIVIPYKDTNPTVDPEEKQCTLTLNKVLLNENGEIVKTIEGTTENFDGSIVEYLDSFDKASVDYDGNKYDFISLDYGFADGSLVGTDYVVTATYKKIVEESQDRLFVKHVYPNGDVVVKEPIYNFDSELLKDENYLLTFVNSTEQFVYDNYKVESASPFGWTDYTLTINYKEKAPEQKNINVQVSIDNDVAGTITSGTDFTLTVNEGEKASVTVTWDLNYRYRTDSITINGVEIDLSSSD